MEPVREQVLQEAELPSVVRQAFAESSAAEQRRNSVTMRICPTYLPSLLNRQIVSARVSAAFAGPVLREARLFYETSLQKNRAFAGHLVSVEWLVRIVETAQRPVFAGSRDRPETGDQLPQALRLHEAQWTQRFFANR